MHSSPSVPDAVIARLDRFLLSRRTEAATHGEDALLLVDAAARSLNGGKRLRARFCAAGWYAVTGLRIVDAAPPDALWTLCAALEVFQSAALVHDDLIDNSDTRRGRPAAHRDLEHRHREAHWSGDDAAFGRAAALLLGDLLVAWSDDLLEEGLAAGPAASAVRGEYARMRREVTMGQFLDIAEESAWSTSPNEEHADRALRVISLKSARYSVEEPLVLGALLAGARPDQVEALRRFGHPLGMAFQLRDDVLGVFGEESVTGKPAGDDLREGKRTVLIAYAREAGEEGRRQIDDALSSPTLTEDEIAELRELIVDSGALARVERLIAAFAAEAEAALAEAYLDAMALTELRELAHAVTTRTA